MTKGEVLFGKSASPNPSAKTFICGGQSFLAVRTMIKAVRPQESF